MGKKSQLATSDPSHFGDYGGVFVPETLMSPLEELEEAYGEARVDEEFQR